MKKVPLKPVYEEEEEDKFGTYKREVKLNEDDDQYTPPASPITINGLPPAAGQVHANTGEGDE